MSRAYAGSLDVDPAPRRARVLRARRLVPAADPLALLAHARPGEVTSCWMHPREGLAIVALGAAVEIRAEGPWRFQAAAAQARVLVERLITVGEEHAAVGLPEPLLVGGFSFLDAPSTGAFRAFPPVALVVPRVLAVCGRSRTRLVASAQLRPGDDTAAATAMLDGWLDDAEAALAGTSTFPWPHAAGHGQPPHGPPGDGIAADGIAADGDEPAHGTEPAHGVRDLVEDPDAYCSAVARALDDIARGRISKVVVARSRRARGAHPFCTLTTLARLAAREQDARVFAIRRGDHTFLGATPERLVRAHRGRLALDALAGTTARGTTPDEDRARAAALLGDAKERAEHAHVVHAIERALAPWCVAIERRAEPEVRLLPGLAHLVTPIEACLAAGRRPFTLLELVEDLHPTPAVAGAPRDRALAWLADHEPLERGWFTGLIGWLDAEGDGELDVALRAALVHDDEAELYAGAGIVEGSVPERELAETALKLATMERALGPAAGGTLGAATAPRSRPRHAAGSPHREATP